MVDEKDRRLLIALHQVFFAVICLSLYAEGLTVLRKVSDEDSESGLDNASFCTTLLSVTSKGLVSDLLPSTQSLANFLAISLFLKYSQVIKYVIDVCL